MLNNFVGLSTSTNINNPNPNTNTNTNLYYSTNQISASDEDHDNANLNPQIVNIQCEKKRNLFSPTQVKILEIYFQKDRYINSTQREIIAKQTGLTSNQVKNN